MTKGTTLYLAYTAPINPPSATPVLTLAQCWSGLQLKIRDAPVFVGAIASCDVLEDSDDERFGTVVREVVFKSDASKSIKETCVSCWPCKVDFHQPDGSTVTNTISQGPTGQPDDLCMTYSFQWLLPDVEAGSKKEDEARTQYSGMAKMAVDKSIEAIRRLVGEGKL
ncbi:hypothetical protein AAFC00_003760 [Neodothiora populina]|uniref:DUF1857-domain-containing protein n=1 Tax=Neodothiora populina TaxID=2781224 RepID=A0ABR3PFB2_9PEZI